MLGPLKASENPKMTVTSDLFFHRVTQHLYAVWAWKSPVFIYFKHQLVTYYYLLQYSVKPAKRSADGIKLWILFPGSYFLQNCELPYSHSCTVMRFRWCKLVQSWGWFRIGGGGIVVLWEYWPQPWYWSYSTVSSPYTADGKWQHNCPVSSYDVVEFSPDHLCPCYHFARVTFA